MATQPADGDVEETIEHPTVLVVDDDPDMLLLCRLQLRAAGFEVLEAGDGAYALAGVAEARPSAIVLDFMLPDMDGVQVLEALKSDTSTAAIPVVMLTARSDRRDATTAWEAGVFDFVTKPFQADRLIAAVRAAVEPPADYDPDRRRIEAISRLRSNDTDAWQLAAAIVAGSEDAIISKTLDGIITSWNRGAEELYGYRGDEVIGQHVSLLAPPDRADEIPAILGRVAKGERIEHFETVRSHRDGRRLDVSLSVSPVRNGTGDIVGASTICRDVTSRREPEKRFRALVEAAPDAMVMVDEGGLIELVNSQTEKLFGYQRAELVGQPVEILVPHRFRARHPKHRLGYVATPRVRPMGAGLELYGLRRDGTEFPVEISLSPLETGEGITVSAAIRDVTERKRAEEALTLAYEREREAAQRLRELDRLRQDFLSTVSHELRTPLSVITGFSDLMRQNWSQFPETDKAGMVERISRAGRRLDGLITDLLDFTRLERGHLKVDIRAHDAAQLLAEALQRAETALEGHRVVTVAQEGVAVMADAGMILRVLENLLTNAAKFSPPDSPIDVAVRRRGGWAELSVRDRGPGIPEDEFERIFERFYRVGQQANRLPGTGIGLAIVKEFTEAQGGRVEVSSTLGEGTEFSVLLPSPPAA